MALTTFYNDAPRIRGIRQMAGKLSGKVTIYYAVDFYERSVGVTAWTRVGSKGDMSSLKAATKSRSFLWGYV